MFEENEKTLRSPFDRDVFDVHPDQQELPVAHRQEQSDIYNPPEHFDNTNKNFKGQHKNEVVHAFCRKHWIVLLPHFLGFIAFLALVPSFLIFIGPNIFEFAISRMTYGIIALLGLGIFTYYLHNFFNVIFNYYLKINIITNFRVVTLDKSLYFTHNRDSIDIREIQDIEIQKNGFFQTVFNYGSIIITLSSAHATKILDCVPNPDYHFRKINKTKREYITSRRVHKPIGDVAVVQNSQTVRP